MGGKKKISFDIGSLSEKKKEESTHTHTQQFYLFPKQNNNFVLTQKKGLENLGFVATLMHFRFL